MIDNVKCLPIVLKLLPFLGASKCSFDAPYTSHAPSPLWGNAPPLRGLSPSTWNVKIPISSFQSYLILSELCPKLLLKMPHIS